MEPKNDNNANFKLRGPKKWFHDLNESIKNTLKNTLKSISKKNFFVKIIFVLGTVAKFALPLILVLAIFSYSAATDPQERLNSSVESYVKESTSMSQEAKKQFNETGSLLLATNDDIKQISDSYLKEISTKRDLLYEAMSTEGKIGSYKFSDIDYTKGFDINGAYEFILNSERMNFNRVVWKKYNRDTGEILDLELQTDETTKLKYPKNDEGDQTDKNLMYFTSLLSEYMQSYVIPSTMLSGAASLKTNRQLGNFAFQIVDKGYHAVEVLQYQMQSAKRNQEKRHYIEYTTEITVLNKKNKKDTDAEMVNIEGSSVKPDEYITIIAYSQSELDSAYEAAKAEYNKALSDKTEKTEVLSSTEKEIEKNFYYPVVKADTYNKHIRVEYEQKKYKDEDVEKFENANLENKIKTKEYKYSSGLEGISVSDTNGWTAKGKMLVTIRYGEDITTMYTWQDELEDVYNEKRDYEVDDVSEYINNIDNIVKDEEQLDENENNGETSENRPDLRLKADKIFSNYEYTYYKELEDDGKLNRVDLVNSVPSLIKSYLTDSEKNSQYIGYHRSKMSISYNLLNKYNMSDDDLEVEIIKARGGGIQFDGTGQDVDYSGLPASSFGWPFPTNRVVSAIQGYSNWYGGFHRGIDIWAVDANGTPNANLEYAGRYDIVAAKTGTVISVYDSPYCKDSYDVNDTCGGWGNNVKIKHDDGYYTIYGHMSPGTIGVKEGQRVQAGQYLGKIGSSGPSSGVHLHFEILYGHPTSQNNVLDPLYFFYVEPYNYNVPYDQKNRNAINMSNPYKVSDRVKVFE